MPNSSIIDATANRVDFGYIATIQLVAEERTDITFLINEIYQKE
jgi:hypothetical protein